MLRLTLANKYQRRTLRPLYAQTQAYPYGAQLSSSFDRTTMFGTSDAAILPGLVASKLVGETVTLAGAANDDRPFGLFANFVGGLISDIPADFDAVGIWRGGGVFQILAPAFTDTGLGAFAAAEDGTAAKEVYMQSGADGALVGDDSVYDTMLAGTGPPVARLIKRLSASAIIVELLV